MWLDISGYLCQIKSRLTCTLPSTHRQHEWSDLTMELLWIKTVLSSGRGNDLVQGRETLKLSSGRVTQHLSHTLKSSQRYCLLSPQLTLLIPLCSLAGLSRLWYFSFLKKERTPPDSPAFCSLSEWKPPLTSLSHALSHALTQEGAIVSQNNRTGINRHKTRIVRVTDIVTTKVSSHEHFQWSIPVSKCWCEIFCWWSDFCGQMFVSLSEWREKKAEVGNVNAQNGLIFFQS